MTIKPILFSPYMAHKLIHGHKYQTRRVLKPQPPAGVDTFSPSKENVDGFTPWLGLDTLDDITTPHKIGDLLYVHEPWQTLKGNDNTPPSELPASTQIFYMADSVALNPIIDAELGKYRQAMHLPRAFSRITLRITNVRIEQVQDISAFDAQWEGAPPTAKDNQQPTEETIDNAYIQSFMKIWDGINAERDDGIYAWNHNPWVVAYTFDVLHWNVDVYLARDEI